ASRHRGQDRGPNHRIPAEKRAVQEGRGADERPRRGREELPETAGADHGGRAEDGTPRGAAAVVARVLCWRGSDGKPLEVADAGFRSWEKAQGTRELTEFASHGLQRPSQPGPATG